MRVPVKILLMAASCCVAGMVPPAAADTGEVHMSLQNGLPFLPFNVMEKQKLVEKHAAEKGLPDLKVTWTTFGGPGGMMQGIVSGQIDVIANSITTLMTMWDKAGGTAQEAKGLSALQSMPYVLVSRNPNVKTIADFTEKDRIAVPEIKLSGHATVLEMAAAEKWGFENYAKLDPWTVSLPHPDATTAMLGGKSEITAHFASSPFYYVELANPDIHKVLSSYDVAGRHTNGVVIMPTKFHDANPKIAAAVVSALEEADAFIKAHPREAAEIYVDIAKEKRLSVDELTRMVADPDIEYTTTPLSVMKFAEFMHKVGRIKRMPASWKDMFFPEAHGFPGN